MITSTIAATPGLPRTGFNSPGLVRLLAALAAPDGPSTAPATPGTAGPAQSGARPAARAAAPRPPSSSAPSSGAPAPSAQSLAERLGPWLGWTDAIALSAALNTPLAQPVRKPPTGPRPGSGPAPGSGPLAAATLAVQRARADLTQAIRQAMTQAGQALESEAAAGTPADTPLDFGPCRRQCQAQQRAMEMRIGALRAQVRALLSGSSARLAQLAALDAVMDQALALRERALLAAVPELLEKHFHRLDQAHLATLAQQPQPAQPTPPAHPADPALAAPCPAPSPAAPPPRPAALPGGWRSHFLKDMQAVLLAELDTRLQPVDGLLDALAHDGAAQP